MAFRVAYQLTVGVFIKRERAERDALINFHVIADDGCAADDDARAVIYEEWRADARRRMYVNACALVRVFGHRARDERHVQFINFVREAIDRYRVMTGIAED